MNKLLQVLYNIKLLSKFISKPSCTH